MALEYKDRVSDTSTTTGTGTFTLAGSAPTGFRTFAGASFTTGATVRYCISSADHSEWEVGQGVWTTSGATLTRVTIYASSNSGSLVSFSAGTKIVQNVMTAADVYKQDAMQVQLTTATNTTATGFQKCPFNNVLIDTGGIWDSANTRAKPQRAGVYSVAASVRVASSGGVSIAAIYKNGSFYATLGYDTGINAFGSGNILLSLNGSTDYIEIWVFCSAVRAYDASGNNLFSLVGPI